MTTFLRAEILKPRRADGVLTGSLTAVALFLALTAAGPAMAQQSQPQPKAAPKAAVQPTPAPAAKAAPAATAPAPPTADAALRQRIEQLEEQQADMQVVIGTLESLARGGGSGRSSGGSLPAAPPPSSGADPMRVEALESQVKALTAQIDQLNQQMRAMTNRPVAAAAPPAVIAAAPPAPAITPNAPPPLRTTPPPAIQERDPIGQIIGSGPPPAAPVSAQNSGIPQLGASDASAKQLYETAYGYLLQQDYGAAETSFDEFLRRYPSDPLAGNAQYWLGESFYVRGQYKASAAAFLKGYQSYGRSSKAPDSLLKLAMSLDRLGQRDSACASFTELTSKFPNAPGAVKNRADNERRRLGCG